MRSCNTQGVVYQERVIVLVSLEKKMFLIPSRLSVYKDKIFVYFKLVGIPPDMKITSMYVNIPLIKAKESFVVDVREITSDWSPKDINKGDFPSRSKVKKILKGLPNKTELRIDVTEFKKKWRNDKKLNFGIYIKMKNKDIKYIENNPPYLIIDTI